MADTQVKVEDLQIELDQANAKLEQLTTQVGELRQALEVKTTQYVNAVKLINKLNAYIIDLGVEQFLN